MSISWSRLWQLDSSDLRQVQMSYLERVYVNESKVKNYSYIRTEILIQTWVTFSLAHATMDKVSWKSGR